MTDQGQRDHHERLTTLARRVVAASAPWMSGERADPAEAELQTALAELAELLGTSGGTDGEPTVPVPAEVTVDLLYAAAGTLHDQGHRVSLLIDLLAHLTDDRLREVVALIPQLTEYPRSRLIAALAGRLDTEQVEAVFGSVMTMRTRDEFVAAVAALLPYVTRLQRDVAVPKVLRQLVGHPYRVSEYLVALAPRLTAPELAEALERFAAVAPPEQRTTTLTWIAAYLTAEQLDDALSLVLELPDGNALAFALAKLAPHLGSDQLERAWAAAVELPGPGHRARALTGLIPHVPEVRRDEAVARAAAAVLAAGFDDSIGNIALTDLVPRLTPDRLQPILDLVRAQPPDRRRGWQLTVLAPYLSAAQCGQALDLAARAADPADRYLALTAIIPRLEPGRREAAVDLAVSALRSHRGWAGLDPRLAAVMTPRQRDTVLEVAASRADQASIVAGLAAHLDDGQLDRALAAGLAATDEERHTAILVALASYVDKDRLRTALSALDALPDPGTRAGALRLAAAQLPTGTRTGAADAALRAAALITDPDARAVALTRLTDVVAAEKRPDVLVRAYTAAMSIEDEYHRLTRLVGLIPACLPSAPTGT